ncbi:hypothetical protein HYW59_04510 [Candidatus Kaiserbacteria bacterium]|nr:hypothetical protein [Candidatus Kaiserbacteria bacterium]
MIIAYTVFFISLAGLVGFFGLKEWESRSSRVSFPALRQKLDEWAFFLQGVMVALKADAEKIPPEMLHLLRILIHEIALSLASLLRFLSLQAHKLAELVSHKRNFVRRAPRSEFLKKVIDHKNDNKGEVDTFE